MGVKQQQFERANGDDWRTLEHLLEALEGETKRRPEAQELTTLPALYRRVCNDYALAHARGYSPRLVDHIHQLVKRAHNQLYRPDARPWWRILEFIWVAFPHTVRTNGSLIWFSFLLFFGPAAVIGVMSYLHDDLIYTVLAAAQVADIESMYDPASPGIGRSAERGADTDFAMFGYYLFNNIGIGFRTFAAGIFFGVGTCVILLFNGLVIGAVAGHVTRIGYSASFWPFVAGHSAFELTAVVICGAAGLLLAKALIYPGKYRRVISLRTNGRAAATLVVGAAGMLALAAFVEAFWSSTRAIAPGGKYLVGAVLWLFVLGYLGFAGRRRLGP
jgi:uncharacterized membrane protein SpoIIM required for sporulation